MESLIVWSHEAIIYTISLLQRWQEQELLTDFHPCWKVLSTDGHLPTGKLGAKKQNSQHSAAVYRITLTSVPVLLLEAQTFVEFHLATGKGVNFAFGVEFF